MPTPRVPRSGSGSWPQLPELGRFGATMRPSPSTQLIPGLTKLRTREIGAFSYPVSEITVRAGLLHLPSTRPNLRAVNPAISTRSGRELTAINGGRPFALLQRLAAPTDPPDTFGIPEVRSEQLAHGKSGIAGAGGGGMPAIGGRSATGFGQDVGCRSRET